MICIAESGSTKTDWVLIDGQQRLSFSSIGFNPFFINSAEIAEAVKRAIPQSNRDAVTNLFFYGAGCSSEERNAIVSHGLQPNFSNATIEVNHDLLAAARAVCLHDAGVACILGTGSNSCYFDGNKITDNVTALGYVLGDEGSGGAMGKSLVKAYIYREMPVDLSDAFAAEYQIDKEFILVNTYNRPQPNRFLASFAPFCAKHRAHEFIQEIIRANFQEFIQRHVLKYKIEQGQRVGFVGSIACTFEKELREVLTSLHLNAGEFVQKPIDRLVEFHSK